MQRNVSRILKARAELYHQRPLVPSTATTHTTEERAWGGGLPESFQTDRAHCQVSHYCLILEFCHVPAEGMLSCLGQEETTARLKHQVNPARASCGPSVVETFPGTTAPTHRGRSSSSAGCGVGWGRSVGAPPHAAPWGS